MGASFGIEFGSIFCSSSSSQEAAWQAKKEEERLQREREALDHEERLRQQVGRSTLHQIFEVIICTYSWVGGGLSMSSGCASR